MQRLEVSGAVRPLYGSLGVKGLRKDPERASQSTGAPFTTEGNVESGGGTHIPGTLKDERRRAVKTGHLSAKDSMKGTLREGPSTGDPDRHVKQGSDMGVKGLRVEVSLCPRFPYFVTC